MFEIEIKKLANVDINQPENLPDESGIYLLIDSANRVWYVGKSDISLRSRHRQHERKADFLSSKADKIAYFVWNDLEDIHELEVDLIRKYNPPLNDLHTEESLPIVDLGYSKDKYLERYKEIRLIQKALEAELGDLKPNLVTLIESNGGNFKTLEFSAYLSKRVTYSYPIEIIALEEKLKVMKKKSEEDKTASVKNISVFPIVR
jgi:hypothetical protein